MKNSLFCSFNSQIYDVLVVFDVLEKVPYFVIFFCQVFWKVSKNIEEVC